MKKLTAYLMLIMVIVLASCGTPKKAVVSTPPPPPPPPAGVEVNNTTTKVFSSINLPKNDYWVVKNEDATFRHDEYLVKRMTPSNGEVAIIRTLSYGGFSKDLNDVSAVVESIDKNVAGMIICYNDFHFKYDSLGEKIKDKDNPAHTIKLDTLENGYVVIVVEAEVKNKNKENRFFGNSYYARNYFFLAEKDDKNKIPIISSSTLLKPENYESEKAKFIELVDYVVNTAILLPDYKVLK